MSFPIFDDNLYVMQLKDDLEKATPEPISSLNALIAGNIEKIPPSSVVKKLAFALEKGSKFSSMRDLLASSATSSPIKDRAERGISAMKSFVLRGKDEMNEPELIDDEQITVLIEQLFSAERQFLSRKNALSLEGSISTTLPRDIRAAPPESFVAKLSEVLGNFRSMKKAAEFWFRVVEELRRIWSHEEYIGGIPLDGIPDLDCCLLYQKLQVINCCVSRKRRRLAAIESLESACPNSEELDGTKDNTSGPKLFARLSTGELVQRLGADHLSDNLVMLETGEPVYLPVTQEGILLTEDLIKETEEFVLQTGSVGAACSHLFSDMQAFKAANPGCILEDFVRWHSPPDWTEAEEVTKDDEFFDGTEVSSKKGFLSKRMLKEGNLWLHLWETAKPIPAARQAPLFDEDLAVDGVLSFLEDISPFELFKQLFVSLLAVGVFVAEGQLSGDENLSKLFYECKDYVVLACRGNIDDKVQNLCQVYETIEAMVLNPEVVLRALKEQTGNVSPRENGNRLRFMGMLGLSFGGKDRLLRNPACKEGQDLEENIPGTGQAIASFFKGKSSLFTRSSLKGCASPPKETLPSRNFGWLVM